jgi:outer membrane protein assembly factor BamB
VACFDADNGRQLWTRDISSVVGLDIGSRGVYVTDDKSAVQAFDRTTGASLWKQDKLFMRGLTRPLVLGRHLVVADFQGHVHLLSDEDGALVARNATDGSIIAAAPQRLASDDGFVVQTKNGAVHALVAK